MTSHELPPGRCTPSAWLGHRAFVILAVALLLPALVQAGTAELRKETGLLRMQAEGRDDRATWLYVPKSYDPTRRYPLIVVLHPAGLRGEIFASAWGDTAGKTGGFIVLAPECRDAKKRMWAMDDEADLVATTKRIMVAYNIDPARVLLTGFSQGAIYAYNFGLRNPRLFRAIAVVGGVLQARPGPKADEILQAARGVPVYICHGVQDDRFPIARARETRERLEKLGYNVTYREDPLMGHAFPPAEYDGIWRWFSALGSEPAPKAAAGRPE